MCQNADLHILSSHFLLDGSLFAILVVAFRFSHEVDVLDVAILIKYTVQSRL